MALTQDQIQYIEDMAGYLPVKDISERIGVVEHCVARHITFIRKAGGYVQPNTNAQRLAGYKPVTPCEAIVITELYAKTSPVQLAAMMGREYFWLTDTAYRMGVKCDNPRKRGKKPAPKQKGPKPKRIRKDRPQPEQPKYVAPKLTWVGKKAKPEPPKPIQVPDPIQSDERIWIRLGKLEKQIKASALPDYPNAEIINYRQSLNQFKAS